MTGRLCGLVLIAVSVLCVGCRKDAEINAALSEVDSFTNELAERIKAAPNPTAGIDEAQRHLDSRKNEMKAKAALLTRVRGIQVSDETEKKLIETVRRDQSTITDLKSYSKYMNLYLSDATFKTKLDKLINDYLELFQA
jgi:hypothetical protein